MFDNLAARINPRSYIARLQRDPRAQAMFDGWVAQATYEAEQRCPDAQDGRQRAQEAARIGIQLAMSFVCDNDGELLAALAERDQMHEHLLKWQHMQPPLSLLVPDPA